jgi:general secretion pathway protein N
VLIAVGAGPASGQTAEPAKSDAGPETVWTLDGLWATRERPLFDADRRPPAQPPPLVARPAPPPPPSVAPASRPPPALILTGIVIAGDKAYAIVSESVGARPKAVQTGQDVGGWRVDQIAPRQVVLTAGTDRVVLELKPRNQPGPAGSQPVRPAAAAAGDD